MRTYVITSSQKRLAHPVCAVDFIVGLSSGRKLEDLGVKVLVGRIKRVRSVCTMFNHRKKLKIVNHDQGGALKIQAI